MSQETIKCDIQQAFVLAAGLGKRIRDYAPDLPKPMVPVAGRSLINRVLDQLKVAGLEEAIINVHYLADKLEAHLATRDDIAIILSDERGQLLETGGGMKKAQPLMNGDAIVGINSDALWLDTWAGKATENTLQAMIKAFDANEMDVLLLMVPLDHARHFEGAGDFHMAADGRLTRRHDAGQQAYVYGGIQIIKPALLKEVAEDCFSLNVIYDKALARGRLFGHLFQGTWMHIGTPDAVQDAEGYFAQ